MPQYAESMEIITSKKNDDPVFYCDSRMYLAIWLQLMDTDQKCRKVLGWYIYTYAENGTECKLDRSHDKQRVIWQPDKAFLEDFGKEMQTRRPLHSSSRGVSIKKGFMGTNRRL